MFIVLLTYVKPLDEVDRHIEAHKAYLDKYYGLGNFIASGPKVPRTGGVILANCESRQEVDRIIAEDPFYQAGVAEYEVVEFVASRAVSTLDALLEL